MEIEYSEKEKVEALNMEKEILSRGYMSDEEKKLHISKIPERIKGLRADREFASWINDHTVKVTPPAPRTKRIKELKKEHVKNLKGGRNKLKSKYGNDVPPHFDFNVDAPAFAMHALSDEVEEEVEKELLGTQQGLGGENFIPQVKTFPIVVNLNVNRLRSAAMQWSICAMAMGIAADETVTVSGGPIGSLYLMYITIYGDLLRAARGQFSYFDEVHPEYLNLRSSLGPRTVRDFSYSFDMDNIASFSDQLAAGIPYSDPTVSYSTSLAWPVGVDQAGRDILTNTLIVVTEDDVENVGIEETEKIWATMIRNIDPNARLVGIENDTGYETIAAAFAQVQNYGSDSYQPFCRITSEVAIPGWAHYLSALDLVNGNDRRGNHIYNETRGPGTLAYRILNNIHYKHHFRIVPKQIPFESFLAAFTSQLVQADIISDDLPTSGTITQPQTSFVASVSSGEIVEYVGAVFCKRYALAAAIMSGVDPLNPDVQIMGCGRQFYVGMDVLSNHIPVQIEEALAELMPFCKKENPKFSLVYVPHITMRGTKTYANVYENEETGDPRSVTRMLVRMYPRIDLGTVFNLGASGSESPFLDIAETDVAFFTGTGPAQRRQTINDMLMRMQGNMDIGSVMANQHSPEYTNLYYTELVEPISLSTNGWANLYRSTITSVSNKYAFDPNQVSHSLLRVLPIVYSSDPVAYIGITGETISVDIGSSYSNMKLPQWLMSVHAVAGIGDETALSDRALILHHKGGGFVDFLKTAGSYALPVLGNIGGSILDQYVPGTGGLVSGLGHMAGGMLSEKRGSLTRREKARIKVARSILKNSHRNPTAKILRPLSNARRSKYSWDLW